MTDTAWPPPWTLKPTEGDPEWTTLADDDGDVHPVPDHLTWDIGFGFTLNVGHADDEDESTPLTIGAHFSDADLARGWVKRQVVPDQLEKLARMLLDVAAEQRARTGEAVTR